MQHIFGQVEFVNKCTLSTAGNIAHAHVINACSTTACSKDVISHEGFEK